jgi:hypothetical protein
MGTTICAVRKTAPTERNGARYGPCTAAAPLAVRPAQPSSSPSG